MHFMILADAAEGAIVQEAQQFGLHARRHFADFIQQHRAAVRLLKEALFPFQRVRIRARRVTKQLALSDVIRDRPAVERQERFFAACAAQMAGACQHIFTGAGVANNQQRRIVHRQLARLVDHLTHFRRHRHDVLEFGVICDAEVLQLPPHARGGFQGDHRAYRLVVLLIFLRQIDRARFHEEITPLDHHMLRLRVNTFTLQPALEIKAGNQRAGVLITDLLFVEVKQVLRRRIRQFDFTFQVEGEHRLGHRHQQRAQRAMFTFRRHE